MKLLSIAASLMLCLPFAANAAPAPAHNPFESLSFLEGTWGATVQNSATVSSTGRYTFVRELDGHVMARHGTLDPNCKAPTTFDCAHGDLLYVFQEAPGSELKAIYFDNEGHVIRYDISTPSPTSAVFLSPAGQGPQFRLSYDLKSGVMTGKFQIHIPGQSDWRTYLEWSGKRE
jgi:hypothetical protein